MLKLEKIIQLLLLAMLTQTGLLLMLHPMPHSSVKQLSTLAFLVFFDDFGQCCGGSSAVWQGGAVRTGGGADADGEFSVIFSFASGD